MLLLLRLPLDEDLRRGRRVIDHPIRQADDALALVASVIDAVDAKRVILQTMRAGPQLESADDLSDVVCVCHWLRLHSLRLVYQHVPQWMTI